MQSTFLSTYVLDTNAIVNLYLLEVGGAKLIEKIRTVYAPGKVLFDELPNVIRKENLGDDLDSYVKATPRIKKVHVNEFNKCLEFTLSWIKSKYYHNPLDDGELHCLALSLLLSRRNKAYVTLITEESDKTEEIIREFMRSQRIGVLLSPMEFMLNLYVRERSIKREQIDSAISDYKVLSTKLDVAALKHEVEELCRFKAPLKNSCGQRCFSFLS